MNATPFLPGLSSVGTKSLTAARDGGNLGSNCGALLLRESARRLGLARMIAAPLPETRNPLLVTHSYDDMVTVRMMAIACGHEDADDLDTLRHDRALKIAIERTPDGAELYSKALMRPQVLPRRQLVRAGGRAARVRSEPHRR